MTAYSLQALVEASGLSESALARRLGWSGQSLKKARANGLSEAQADRGACRLGLHPDQVWDHWFEPFVGDVLDSEIDHKIVSGRAKKTEPRRLHLPGEIASSVVYRNVTQRLKKQGLSLERYQLRGFSLAERAVLAERENADMQAKKAAVGRSQTSHSRGTVAA